MSLGRRSTLGLAWTSALACTFALSFAACRGSGSSGGPGSGAGERTGPGHGTGSPTPSPESGRPLGVEPLASDAKVPFVPSDACRASDRPFAQPIALVEDAGLPRYPPVLGFPIAFAREAGVVSLNGFVAATLQGRPLATQLEALSRWGGGPEGCHSPIRWAYVRVLADVRPNARAYLTLRREPGVEETRGPGLTVRSEKGTIVVDTGVARFTLDTQRFDGLARVELRGPSGFETFVEHGLPGEVGLLADQGEARIATAFGRVESAEVEARGPLVATVAVKGSYARRNGEVVFRSTIRLSFYAGTGVVLFDHTYYNGDTLDLTAQGGKNRTRVDRVFLRLPLALGAEPEVVARGREKVFRRRPRRVLSVAQAKRSPDRPAVVYSVREGHEILELGTFAEHPMLAVRGGGRYAVATLGSMATRDPEALRYDPKGRALEVDFQSEALFVGGARGIWAKAVLDFGRETKAGPDLPARGDALYAHATRPLIGAPSTGYLNTTGAHGTLPKGELGGSFAAFDARVDAIHEGTARYLRRYRVTGTQIWPDLPRRTCEPTECAALERGYFEGGDCNYWDWSLIELDAFLRTADPSFLHDFALPEAITMAETVSFRPSPSTKAGESSFAGFSPCYGGGRGDDGEWLEGLNHRRGVCPGDYSYNKVHQLAYVLTGDRRFTDLFTQGAETAIRLYKDPRQSRPDTWLELSASRTTYQYLELLLDAAEFARIGGDAANRRYRDRARLYFDHMRATSLERGHTCNLLGSGEDDPKVKGTCLSDQAWMLPVWAEWVLRLHRLEDHAPAKAWLLELGRTSAERYTVTDGRGRPDISQLDSSGGWRTMYRCYAGKQGIQDETCAKFTQVENEGRFYPNGLVAFLNTYGVILDADPTDPLGLCGWLPDAYARALKGMDQETSDFVWGKAVGQAYGLTQTTLGALERACGSP